MLGLRVLIVDKRPHIGGNAYDRYDDAGVLVHPYGPHIFHTNSSDVFGYLTKFTKWRPYQHRVLASVDGQLLPIPINLETVNKLYGLNLTSFEMEDFLESVAEKKELIKTSEDVVVSKVGRDLYNKFFRGYTRKQWGLDPSELDASVTARVPTRTNSEDRNFSDIYQAIPLHGYTRMFESMLDHLNIKVMLNTDYREVADLIPWRHMIYTGPIDVFFNCKYAASDRAMPESSTSTALLGGSDTRARSSVRVSRKSAREVSARLDAIWSMMPQRTPACSFRRAAPSSRSARRRTVPAANCARRAASRPRGLRSTTDPPRSAPPTTRGCRAKAIRCPALSPSRWRRLD